MGYLTTVLLGVLALTVVIVGLVLLLMFCERKLVRKGRVKVVINGDESKSPLVDVGSNLLKALADQQVFLASACGGKGSCAMCKCQVLEGGGNPLPSEMTHLSRSEAKDHWRLACQVKVREPMQIRVPPEVFSIRKWTCTVKSNRGVATFIKELVVDLPPGEFLKFQPGDYIQIDVPEYQGLQFSAFEIEPQFRPDWEKHKLFDLVAENLAPCFRAYSMANHPAEGNKIMTNIRIATPPPRTTGIPPGVCSSYTFSLKPGDQVTISGPYGEFHIKDTGREMVYIGGGAGMAPLRAHIFHLFHTQETRRKVSYWYGARSKREMFYTEDFAAIERRFDNFRYHVALSEPLPEDDWKGYTGFIHQVVHDHYLKQHKNVDEVEFYLCGPPMMLTAVQKMLAGLGVEPEQIAFDDFGS
jgi:Na+-transporting NADH:ubiquinone oxidoreductase subunit F